MKLGFWKKPPNLSFSKNVKRNRPPRPFQGIRSQKGYVAVLWFVGLFIADAVVAATVATVITVVLYAAVIAYSIYNVVSASSQSKKARGEGTGMGGRDPMSSGHLLNTRASSEPIAIPYGDCRVGGNIVYVSSTGTNNEILHIVMTVGEGPVDGLVTDGNGAMIWLDDKRIQDYGTYAAYEFFTGTSDQNVCGELQSHDPNWDDAMRYTAYIYVQLAYNEQLFASMPQITMRLRGRILYDHRNGSTAYSNNPALVAYDFLTNERYSIGFPASAFDTDSFGDVANWADTNTYTFNGPIMKYQTFLDNLDDILKNFRSGIIWSEGEYKLIVYEYDTPIMTLTEDEIVADSFRISIPGIPETPNRVVMNYIDAVDNYLSKQRIIEDTDAVLAYDKEERDFSLDLIGTTNATQAEKLGSYYVERIQKAPQ